jgi:predicted Zn-dependent protease
MFGAEVGDRLALEALKHDHGFGSGVPSALWQLVQVQQADGQIESALTTLTPLLNNEPSNPAYLMMAADLELSLYLTQRSYLNHVNNKRTLALLERLLEIDVANKVRIYRKIAQAYAADRHYATSLGYLEQAAKYKS